MGRGYSLPSFFKGVLNIDIVKYYRKKENVQVHECSVLYLKRKHLSIYVKKNGKSTPSVDYFKVRSYLMKQEDWQVRNIYIYLSENSEISHNLYSLVEEANKYTRVKQIQEAEIEQKNLSKKIDKVNYSYNWEEDL